MNNKLVIFGPWCGEFCYELSWWIPEIRKRSKEDFNGYDVFVVGYEGRSFLYKDFSFFVTLVITGVSTSVISLI